jgi:hypothetical protein
VSTGSEAGDCRFRWGTPTSRMDGRDPSVFSQDIASHHCFMSVQHQSEVELVCGHGKDD